MILENLEKGIQTEVAVKADLAHLRGQERTITTCTVRNGVVENFSNVYLKGISARVLWKGTWGFNSTNRVDLQDTQNVLLQAWKSARAADRARQHEHKQHLAPAKIAVADDMVSPQK